MQKIIAYPEGKVNLVVRENHRGIWITNHVLRFKLDLLALLWDNRHCISEREWSQVYV